MSSRSERDHQRYMENREEILAKQKAYREDHKEDIRERRRQRNFERAYLRPKKKAKTRQELNHSYYLRHRDRILAKAKRNYELRSTKKHPNTIRCCEQQPTA